MFSRPTAAGFAGLLACLSLLGACSGSSGRDEIIVGAASSLEPLLTELEKPFEEASGIDVTFTFNASGALARQIEQGAPIDVYISASAAFVEDLAGQGLVVSASVRLFGVGRLAIVTSRETRFYAPPDGAAIEQIAEAQKALLAGARRLAIANPEIAPYGAAAKALLVREGIWNTVQGKLVFGENVLQVLQFVDSGNADVGFVPLSLVADRTLSGVNVIPIAMAPAGDELEQTVAVVAESGRQHEARQFIDFLLGPSARSAMQRRGFLTPISGEGG